MKESINVGLNVPSTFPSRDMQIIMTDKSVSYKLTYFDLRALGEPIRWIFKISNVPFEDDRIALADWPKLKETVDWQQLPVLEVNGTKLHQSSAIGRYLAKKYGLIPSDELKAAKCDELVDAINDLRLTWRPYFLMNRPTSTATVGEKEDLKKQLLEKNFPVFLKKFEEAITSGEAGSSKGFIFGDKVYWADFWLTNFCQIWEESLGSDLLDPYPALRKQNAAVFGIPQIQEWVEKRPKTFV